MNAAPALAAAADVAWFLLGAALLLALARPWRADLPLRAGLGYLLLTGSFFGAALATPGLQVGSDIPYLWRPWAVTVDEGFQPANDLLSDVPLQFVPFRAMVRARLLAGEAPLWAHELGTGQPLLANGQSAPFAPLHLLALPLPAMRALTVAAAWQTLVALLLTHLLLRRLGAEHAGAALAAVTYALSTWAVAWAYHPHAMVAAFLPGVLAGVVATARGERLGRPLLGACALAMATSGHAETLAHGAIVAAAVAAVLWLRRPAIGRGRFAGRLAAVGLLVAGLSAPVLLPLLEAIPHSERLAAVTRAPQTVWPPKFAWRHLLPLVSPLAFGSPRDDDWTGPANFNEMCTGHAGLAALAVALAGAVALRRRVLGIVAAGLVALGGAVAAPPFFAAWQALPLLEHAAHARLRLLWVLAVAVAAGLSLEPLARRRRGPAAAAFAAVALAAALVPVGDPPWQRAWQGVAVAGAAAVAVAAAVPRLRGGMAWAAVAAAAAELWVLGFRYHPVVPATFDLAPPPALAALIDRNAALPSPRRVVAWRSDLRPNLASLHGLWDARVYDPMHPARAITFVGSRLLPRYRTGRPFQLREDRLDQPLMDFLAVGHVLGKPQGRMPPPWQSVAVEPGGRLWHNPEALDLFHFAARVERAADAAAARAAVLRSRDFRALATVVDPAGALPEGPQSGAVRAIRSRSNGFDLELDAPAGGVLTSSVSWAPGWRATTGDRRLPVVLANGAFLGVGVPPGTTTLALDYRPAGWRWGLALAAAALLGLAAAAAATLRGRRTPEAAGR